MELSEFLKIAIAILIMVLILVFIVYYALPNIKEGLEEVRNRFMIWQ